MNENLPKKQYATVIGETPTCHSSIFFIWWLKNDFQIQKFLQDIDIILRSTRQRAEISESGPLLTFSL